MAQPPLHALFGNELRWGLARELSRSDLTVGELTTRSGEPQNLVSYHLRVLREAGLVGERRSSADGRDVYYSLDRRAVSASLLGALAEVSPGAGVAEPGSRRLDAVATDRPASVLFLCTGNSARSQIAEAMLRQLGGRRLVVRSAGTHPAGIHPAVFEVLKSREVRAGRLRSKSIVEFAGQQFDYVVTLCDIARTESIELSGRPQVSHWSIPDPVSAKGGRGAVAKAFELVAGEIQARVGDFYRALQTSETAA